MSGKSGYVNAITGDDQANRTNMMEMWNDSIRRTQEARKSPIQVAKEENEAKAALEQKIRSGQAQCPTCAARTYQDNSSDGSVSFQAPKHIAAAASGAAVMNHESEHVAGEAADALEKGGQVTNSTVALEYAKCPECGRTYVAGGVTSTTKTTPAKRQEATRPASFGILDIGV